MRREREVKGERELKGESEMRGRVRKVVRKEREN